jgi:hypothetical protein
MSAVGHETDQLIEHRTICGCSDSEMQAPFHLVGALDRIDRPVLGEEGANELVPAGPRFGNGQCPRNALANTLGIVPSEMRQQYRNELRIAFLGVDKVPDRFDCGAGRTQLCHQRLLCSTKIRFLPGNSFVPQPNGLEIPAVALELRNEFLCGLSLSLAHVRQCGGRQLKRKGWARRPS